MEHRIIDMRASDGSVVKLECHNALSSTVTLAKKYAKLGYPDRYVVLAESKIKTDADGHKGNFDKGLFMSCILRPSIFPSQASLISSLSAVALATALEQHTSKNIGIGWVSKIYCDGKIIGEAHIEGKLDDFKSYEYLIITFSVSLDKNDFPPKLADIIKKVFESENPSIPLIIAKDILNNFFQHYSTLKKSTKFMTVYSQKFILRGKKIHYLEGGKKKACKVLGVDTESSALIVENQQKKVVYLTTPNSVFIPKRISIK